MKSVLWGLAVRLSYIGCVVPKG